MWLDVKVRPQKINVGIDVESMTSTLTAFLPDLVINNNEDILGIPATEQKCVLTIFSIIRILLYEKL